MLERVYGRGRFECPPHPTPQFPVATIMLSLLLLINLLSGMFLGYNICMLSLSCAAQSTHAPSNNKIIC